MSAVSVLGREKKKGKKAEKEKKNEYAPVSSLDVIQLFRVPNYLICIRMIHFDIT